MDTGAVLALMQEVADEVINPRFGQLVAGEVDQKAPGDFVTAADREAEALLTARLAADNPDALIVGEEAAFTHPELLTALADAEHAFTVDPVDGTSNFVRGSADHAVMLAELRRGEVVRSWIWQPQHGNSYVAELGSGVRWNDVEMSAPTPAEPPRGATSRRAWRGFTADGALAPVVSTRYCAAVDYPQLLHGRLEFLTYRKQHPWDHLPGQLMLRELGGDIVRLDGEPYRPGLPTHECIVAGITRELALRIAGLWDVPEPPRG